MLTNCQWALIFMLTLHFALALGQADSTNSFTSYDNTVLHTQADTVDMTPRKFSEQKIRALKSDPDLSYSYPPTVAESLWGKFKQWLWELITDLLRGATTTRMGWIIVYTLGGALLVYLILTLLRVNAFRLLFSGGDERKDDYRVLNENIHEMDFEKLIHDAVIRKDFRLGTRLIFLFALKTLADSHLVDWDPGKTNHDYLEELKRADLREGFNHLSLYFDYAWYGNFEVSSAIFQRMQNIFYTWKDQVNS